MKIQGTIERRGAAYGLSTPQGKYRIDIAELQRLAPQDEHFALLVGLPAEAECDPSWPIGRVEKEYFPEGWIRAGSLRILEQERKT